MEKSYKSSLSDKYNNNNNKIEEPYKLKNKLKKKMIN